MGARLRTSSALVFALLLLGYSSALAGPPRVVLLTAFEPFAGRAKNGSQMVAEILKSSSYLKEKNVDLRVCIIPVEYEQGAKRALECLVKLGQRPTMMVSTGEAACDVRLETRFHNLDDTPGLPDNKGVTKTKKPIKQGAPAELPSNLPLADMYCAQSNPAIGVSPSNDPGNFVCNSTAYRIQLRLLGSPMSFGFIHLPQAACNPETIAAAAKAMEKMIVAGADAVDSYRALAGSGRRTPNLPIDQNGVARESRRFARGKVKNSCGTMFYEALTREYADTRSLSSSVVPIEKRTRR